VGFAAVSGASSRNNRPMHPLVWYDDAVGPDGNLDSSCAVTNGGLRTYGGPGPVIVATGALIPRDVSENMTFAACDVDGDGRDDLISQKKDPATRVWSLSLTLGGDQGWPAPLDLSRTV